MKPHVPTHILALIVLLSFGGGFVLADEDSGFELVRGAAPNVRVRQNAALSLSIVPHANHRLLASGPVTIRLHGENLKLPRTLYHRDEAVDPRADVPRFELQVSGEKPGPAKLEADCTFYLCRADLCRPVETSTSFTFDVVP